MTKPKRADYSIFGRKDPHPERAIESDPEQVALQETLDEALKETFPASDPASASQPSKPGRGRR